MDTTNEFFQILKALEVIHQENKELMRLIFENRYSIVTQTAKFDVDSLPIRKYENFEFKADEYDEKWDKIFKEAINKKP